MRFLLNDTIISTGQTLPEIKNLLHEYGFKLSIPENYPNSILHGKLLLKKINHRIVIHIYFSKCNGKLESIVIHPFPMNFEKIQRFLEEQFKSPSHIVSGQNAAWEFEDGEVIHQIIDRFGDEEMVYLKF